MTHPIVVALDVNETLTDQSPLAQRLEHVGAPGHLLATWFAATLRDGFALTLGGGYGGFASVAAGVLRTLLSAEPGLDRDVEAAVVHRVDGLAQLPLHDDVAPGVAQLRQAGFRVIALTNGATETAEAVLRRGGVAADLEHILSIESVKRWKPAPETYRFAAERCRVGPEHVLLAAVHPWDLDGARRAGLSAGWVNRTGAPYPEAMLAPDVTGGDLVELAEALARSS